MTRVLVLGDYRQSLTIARSLAARGDRVIAAVHPERPSYLRRSRAVATRWFTEHQVGDDEYEQAVLDAVDRYEAEVAFPVGDLEIGWVAADPGRLGIPVASAAPEIATLCQDKPALLAVCDDLDVGHSSSRVVSSPAALREAVAEFGLPAIVKSNDPLLRVLGRKGVVLRSDGDVAGNFSTWPDAHDSLIVQRYVDGPRHNLYFVAERGELRGVSEVEIIRTDMPDGTGYAVDGHTVPVYPSLLAQTERLVSQLKYHGVGCSQFLVSPSGETSFLELNPRLGANFAVVDRAGLPLSRAAVDLALDRALDTYSVRTGIRYAWVTGDLEGLLAAARRGDIGALDAIRWLGRTFRSAFASDVHVTWSWRDPWPTAIRLWRGVVRRFLGMLLRRS